MATRRPARGSIGGAPGSGPNGDSLTIDVLSRQRRWRCDVARLRGVLHGAARALEIEAGEVVVVLTGDRLIEALNRRYRGQARPTDVLSFGAGMPPSGDIVISVETAERYARAHGRTLAGELDHLALHGFLHLVGHDHETDGGVMRRLERRLARQLLERGARARPGKRGARSVGR